MNNVLGFIAKFAYFFHILNFKTVLTLIYTISIIIITTTTNETKHCWNIIQTNHHYR